MSTRWRWSDIMNDLKVPEKECDPDDPMELHAHAVPGDAGLMLDQLIEEFARMGWDAVRIEYLFQDPFYQAMHDLKLKFGLDAIRARITAVLSRHGVLRVSGEQ